MAKERKERGEKEGDEEVRWAVVGVQGREGGRRHALWGRAQGKQERNEGASESFDFVASKRTGLERAPARPRSFSVFGINRIHALFSRRLSGARVIALAE